MRLPLGDPQTTTSCAGLILYVLIVFAGPPEISDVLWSVQTIYVTIENQLQTPKTGREARIDAEVKQ